MLTPQQLKHYETFGFVILRDFFSSKEMETISDEFERGLDAAYSHETFDGTKRQWTPLLGPETPLYARLPEDPRFCDVAGQLCGEDCFLVVCDGNRYVGDSGWHPDHDVDPTKDCWGVKFAFYLDPVGADTGALRVIPGSHRNPYHNEVKATLAETRPAISEVPSYVCESEPGDVVAFDMRCWHASCGGAEGRRMSTAVFYHNPETPVEKEATRKRGQSNAGSTTTYRRPNDPIYDPNWLLNPDGSERRTKWINKLREFGFV
ncbi:MAG: phytanoyl-CoA dioxygenase family protein [Planctomycetota bacterium]|nr:phytanoyl-CoA dioxygenase family protein [Planctomycetota bacterium]MDA1138824.1 phytanoyl-CoA dioxygenase family protein [Planctomycetota bacterium]